MTEEKERPYTNGTSNCTILRYTHPTILKTIENIRSYAKDSDNIVEKDIKCTTFTGETKDEYIAFILTIPLSERLNEQLDRIYWKTYGNYEVIGNRKNMTLCWKRDKEDNGYWNLDIEGDIQCKRFNRVIENENFYKNCRCPKGFIETCSDLISILKNPSNNEK